MYVGPGLQLEPHSNAAATIAIALKESFSLRTFKPPSGWSEWRSCMSALIPSETLHHIKSDGPLAFLYLDPVTDRQHPLTQEALDRGRAQLLQMDPKFGIHDAFGAFDIQPQRARDARIERVVLEIEKRPAAFGRLAEAAELACLSPSRFRARFQVAVGLPFRRYRMWRRMAIVMRAVAQGQSLTTAAIESGFSSSAHLSSAFKGMFGLSASEVIAMGVALDISEDRVEASGSIQVQKKIDKRGA